VGMCLMIATIDFAALGNLLLVILMVAVGLGTVIFVHELGHFAVAKMCGVRCDKFFIGFDIGGYKISRKWGETEYGIGILPLGGYVKMMGQDDNPANIAEQVKESQVAGNTPESKEIVGPDGKTYLVDRRSYLAKSVPQRMAIISAGVIMNIIFAFIFATVAYKIGVPFNPVIVSQTSPGSPAWRAAVRPGDEVIQVGDIENPSFAELMGSVTLADLKSGLPFVLERGDKRIKKRLVPEQESDLARVGLAGPSSLRLAKQLATRKETPAAAATPAFQGGDEIVAINGKPVANHAEFMARLIEGSSQPLTVTVLRDAKRPAGKPEAEPTGGEKVEIVVAPRPQRHVGLVMQMGKVVAVQDHSPAADAGLQAGDFIESMTVAGADGEEKSLIRDPLALPETLRQLGQEGAEVQLVVRRAATAADGKQATETLTAPLRPIDWIEEPISENDPVAAPALGIAYRVLTVVKEVEADGPAAKAGLQKDDVLLSAEVLFPEEMADKPEIDPVTFSQADKKEGVGWPQLMSSLQMLPAGAQLKLTYKRGADTKEAVLTPVEATERFVVDRGLVFEWVNRIRISDSWSEAASRGLDETTRSLTMVYRFLSKLGGQVPVTMLGGPITIAKAASYSADEGLGKLLVFLTMLSANLAVINFLPIPMLDGGHMVFLAWEGIRGRPASERVVMTMQTAGMVFLITLMLFVFSLDLQRMFFA
jgi:regulator of sigma E protease